MTQLAEHARAIWQAGVDAVDSEKTGIVCNPCNTPVHTDWLAGLRN